MTENQFKHFILGLKLQDNGDLEFAIEECSKVIALKPEDPEAYDNRGCVYDDLGKYDLAIADYDKAIALNANYTEAYYNRGSAFYRQKQYDAASKDYERALEIEPDHQLAQLWLSNARRKLAQ